MIKERKSNIGNPKQLIWNKKETSYNHKFQKLKDKINYLKWLLQDFRLK